MNARLTPGILCVTALLGLIILTGCPRPTPPIPDPISLDQQVELMNQNLGRINTGLKAFGPVTASFVDDKGIRHRQALHGNLLIRTPSHVRFEMSILGKTEIQLGSNKDTFWVYTRADNETYRWGHHRVLRNTSVTRLPIRPDLICDALGVNAMPYDTTGTSGPVQRITDAYQELIFLGYDETQQGYIEKEYWFERQPPRLLRRIIFRDVMGRIRMLSELSDYKPLPGTDILLPTRYQMRWPEDGGSLDFRVEEWTAIPELTADAPSFRLPHLLGFSFRNIRCVDTD